MCSKRKKYSMKYQNSIEQNISKETQMYYACTAHCICMETARLLLLLEKRTNAYK